jgi:hypothetical protein
MCGRLVSTVIVEIQSMQYGGSSRSAWEKAVSNVDRVKPALMASPLHQSAALHH